MQASFRLDKDQYYDALGLSMEKPFLLRLPHYVFLTVFIIAGLRALYFTLCGAWGYLPLLILTIGLLAFLALYRPVIVRRQIKKYFETSIDVELDTQLELTEQEFKLEREMTSVSRPWSKLAGWKEDDKMFLLYVSDRTFHVIPKRVLNEMEGIDELIKEKLNEFDIPYLRIPPGSILAAGIYLALSVVMLYSILR